MNTKNKDLGRFIAAILVLFVLLAFSATASAAVINVPSAGNETIQQAINNATAGDTILVNATAYNAQGIPETVIVNKSDIIIRSVNGRAVVSASSSPNKHVFDITDQTNVTLEGFEIRDANGTAQSVAGIYMDNASECNISDNLMNNTAYSNNNLGIELYYSSNNNLTSNTASSNDYYGICLSYSSNYNTLTNNTASSNNGGGIRLSYLSNYNTLTNNTASSNDYYGILLLSSSNTNTLTNNTASSNNGDGIRLSYSSNYNTLTNNTASNNTNYDFYSDANSHDNTVKDLTVASYPTTLSFTYKNGVGLKGVETGTAPPDPAGKTNIGKYVNATNVTANSWLFLNVSYEDVDLGGVDENSLRMWKHNGTDWTEVPGTNGTNTAENYVYANITEFGSIFAPLGKPPVNCTCGDICVNETGWWRDGGAFNLNNTPIQAAIDNATVGETICVKDGTYNETVDVTKSDLTIRSENGSSVTTVSASLSPDDHVVNITDQTNVTLEGFTIRDAYGANKDVTGIYMKNASECNISNNVVMNISATSTYTAYGVWLNASDNNIFKNISMPGGISSGGAACGLYLESSNNNSMQDATLGNITAEYLAGGIMLRSSNNNSIDPKIGNIRSNNGFAIGVGLYESDENEITSLDFGKVSGGGDEAHGIYIEDSWYNNLSLNMISRDDIIGNGTNVSGVFMHNANFTRITGIEFGAIRNIKTGDTITYGVYMENSNDNFLDPAMGNITNEGGVSIGLGLINSNSNTVENTTLGNITAEYLAGGIMLRSSNNNSIDPKIGNIRSNNGFAIGVGLYESDENEITSLDFGKVSGGGDEAHGIYIEDSWYNNLSLNMISRDDIIGNGTNVSGVFMHNANFTRITGIEFGAIRNIKTGDTITYGVYMENSNDNFLDPAMGNITNEGGVSIGLGLINSNSNTVENTTLGNITAEYLAGGIMLRSSNNNSIDPKIGNIRSNNGFAIGVGLYESDENEITSLDFGKVSGGGDEAHGIYIEDSWYNNLSLNMISRDDIIGNGTNVSGVFMHNANFTRITGIEFGAIRNIKTGDTITYGVYMENSNDNFLDPAMGNITNEGGVSIGLGLINSNSNTVENTTLGNITAEYLAGGIMLRSSNNNSIDPKIGNIRSNNGFAIGVGLYESDENEITSLDFGKVSGGGDEAHGIYIEDSWYNNLSLNMISRDDIIGNGTNVSGVFMHNANFTRITGIEFGAIRNIKTGDTITYGVYMENSNDNFLDPAMGNITNEGGVSIGLGLINSNSNTVENTTLGNITAEYLAGGIMLRSSNNNSIDPKIGNIRSNNGFAIGVGLYESDENEITSLDFGKVSGGGDEAHGIYIEDSWYNNLSLNMISRDDIIGNGTNVSGVFMHNANFTRITGIEFGAIRNIKIGDTNTYGIYMENSNDNFLDPAMGNITNEGGVSIGLGLINSNSNTVENTTLGNITAEYLAGGIMLRSSNNNSIDPKIGNIRSNNGFAIGVGLYESDENEITSLDFGKVSGGGDEAHGIYIEDSWYNNLSLNMISRDDIIGNGTNVSGVFMHNANFTRITGIEFGAIRNIKIGDTNTYGIYMENSNDNFLDPAMGNITNAAGNFAFGLFLADSSNNSFTDTTIRNVTGNYMAAGIGLFSSNNNTFDPTIIEDINGSSALGVVFMFSNSTSFTDTTIKNVTGILATGISFGILDPAGGYPLLGFSNYNTFTDTTIRNVKGNMTAGISLIASNNNTFDPTVIENVEGIEVSSGVFLFATNDTNFTDTAISSVTGYMAAGISLFASNSNTFDPTEIENVNGTYTAAGVYLNFTNNNVFSETKVHEVSSLQPENSFGFYLMESSYNNVTDGEIFNCTRGTRIDSGWYNTIERNIIRDNFDTGVLLDGSASYTEIHTNCFYNNSPQAMDDGANNNWTGNYWSDYIPPGPYNISGVAGSKDNEPLDECPLGEGPPPNITSFAPPSPVNDTVCTWRTFNVTVNQTVNVSWYLNGTAQVTKNVSVTEANFTFHAQYIGVHNVSAVAENANGTDMQTWAWNVTAAPAAAPNITSFAPPSPVNDTICHWRTFNVTVNQTVNVSWYLNESFLHTNESVTEANYTLHAEFVGDNNVSAVATNANGTDMQTWVWNVTAAPVFGAPNITSFAPPSLVNDTICHWRTFNVTVNQTVNVSWYLNESFLFTNESVTEANYTLHAEFVGDNNVSAVATNANGTDMQTWVWNVTAAPVFGAPNITSFAPPSPVNDTVCHWRTFNVTVNQTVNVSWYLNESFQHTNESVTEANYTLHAEFMGDNNVSAVATNANGTDMQTWVWNVSSLDNDGDGVSNAVEDGAPNNGDGNGDGTPDRDQSNVTSLPTATNRGYMTLVLSNCTQLKNVTALPEAPVDPEYDYPYGLVSFEIMCENGTVNITYHDAAALTGYTYRKYGPTTPGDLGTIRWYDFSTYATIAGNRVTLSFQDNRLGDGTGDDGKIVDPGGPGISGVVAQVPVLTPIGMIALVGLLSVIAAININLRKRR